MPRHRKDRKQKQERWDYQREHPPSLAQAPRRSPAGSEATEPQGHAPSNLPQRNRRNSKPSSKSGIPSSEGSCKIRGLNDIWYTFTASIAKRRRCLSCVHIHLRIAEALGYTVGHFNKQGKKVSYRYPKEGSMRSPGTVRLFIKAQSGKVEEIDALVWVGQGASFDIEIHKSIAYELLDISDIIAPKSASSNHQIPQHSNPGLDSTNTSSGTTNPNANPTLELEYGAPNMPMMPYTPMNGVAFSPTSVAGAMVPGNFPPTWIFGNGYEPSPNEYTPIVEQAPMGMDNSQHASMLFPGDGDLFLGPATYSNREMPTSNGPLPTFPHSYHPSLGVLEGPRLMESLEEQDLRPVARTTDIRDNISPEVNPDTEDLIINGTTHREHTTIQGSLIYEGQDNVQTPTVDIEFACFLDQVRDGTHLND